MELGGIDSWVTRTGGSTAGEARERRPIPARCACTSHRASRTPRRSTSTPTRTGFSGVSGFPNHRDGHSVSSQLPCERLCILTQGCEDNLSLDPPWVPWCHTPLLPRRPHPGCSPPFDPCQLAVHMPPPAISLEQWVRLPGENKLPNWDARMVPFSHISLLLFRGAHQ